MTALVGRAGKYMKIHLKYVKFGPNWPSGKYRGNSVGRTSGRIRVSPQKYRKFGPNSTSSEIRKIRIYLP